MRLSIDLLLAYSRKIVPILLFLFIFSDLSAQKPPIKYGKVSMDELQMEYYDLDSTAPAVILCDYGKFSSSSYNFVRIIRIKILKKEGYEWASHVFYSYDESDVRGKTFNLVDGEIVSDKLKSESVYKERVTEDFWATRIAMPNVKVGSIIEIEISHFGIPREWKFQNRIPVKWSELIIEPTSYIIYHKNFFGYEPLNISTPTRWVGQDMPAFKPEPFISSVENYLTKFEFDIRDIEIPSLMYYKSIASSWESICEVLEESRYFGVPLKASGYLKKTAQDIELNYPTAKERLLAAYEHVKKVKWNGESRKYISNLSLQTAYKEETGNSADINLILVQLLKRLDFEVYPVALSTKSNGILSKINPSFNKLNYIIAHVVYDSTNYLLDATDELIPIGMLPERCINDYGRIIDEDKSDWIELKTEGTDLRIAYYDLSMNDNLSFSGKISYKYASYGAYRFRKEYEEFADQDDYVDDFKSDKPSLKITETKMESVEDIYEPVTINHEVKIDNQAMPINDKIYLNPMFYQQMKENYFKIDEREYPVDFVYPFSKSVVIKLAIPENYTVLELPESIMMSLPDKSASFAYSVSNFSNVINIMCKIDVKKAVYFQNEYGDLKEFFNQIIKKHSEPLILQKK